MKNVFLFCVMFLCIEASAQKNDYVWLTGYEAWGGCNASPDGCFGINRINFNTTPPSVNYDNPTVDFRATNACYSTDIGNLLFYTNGMFIYNTQDLKVEGSDTLNPGYAQQYWSYRGYDHAQGIVALPIYNEPNNYYLLHTSAEKPSNSVYPRPNAILLTKLDMNANGGLGKVVFKNQIVYNGPVGQNLAALRHGNGRDWWVLNPYSGSTCPNKILLDHNGAHVVSSPVCNGPSMFTGIVTETCFSPNGDWYIYNDDHSGTHVFSMNRCTGEMDIVESLNTAYQSDSFVYSGGVAISPNSRYLYVSNSFYVIQFDLQAVPIASSADTVAVFDGYQDPFNSYFTTMRLAPNGKIYVCSAGSETNFTVIENPDQQGLQCNVNQHGMQLPSFSLGLPNFPNYRLGNWQHGVCDYTYNGIGKIVTQRLSIYPNPATNMAKVEYDGIDWNKGAVSLQLLSALGQTVYTQPLPYYTAYREIDIAMLPGGIYTVQILQNDRSITAIKLVKQ